MEDDEGGEGYGFARRNNAARKKAGRRAAAHAGASAVPGSYEPLSQKPAWIWLLTGLLLGIGGTLLTASFWLPENGSVTIAALETGEHPSEGLEGVAAVNVTAPSMPETTPPEKTVSEPRPKPTLVVAQDIEGPAATPSVDEVLFGTDDAGEDLLGVTPDTDTLDIEPPDIGALDVEASEAISETQQPAVAIDADADAVSGRPVDNETSFNPSSPRQALKALVSEAAAAKTARFPPLPDDRSRGPGSDQADQTQRTPPRPENPAPSETPADLAVAALPATPVDDEPAEHTTPEPGAAETEPSSDAVRDDLPPRIKAALRQARAAAQSTETGPRNSGRLYRVQLVAVDNEAAARAFWQELNERLPGVFADVEPVFDQRLVDERLYLRVWVGAFESRLDADGYCGWLKLKGQDCFVTQTGTL